LREELRGLLREALHNKESCQLGDVGKRLTPALKAAKVRS
jgi:hypothetical protein